MDLTEGNGMAEDLTAPPSTRRRSRRTAALLVAATSVLAISGAGILNAVTATAASEGCQVTYSVASQWNSGFTGNVSVTNLGSAISGWSLTWTFPGDQQITQSWNSSFSQTGAAVTMTNAGWNASIASNASVGFGFNATWSGSNTNPTTFALNGVTCTGQTSGTSATATATSTATATATASKTASAAATASATSSSTATTGWAPPTALVTPLAEVWSHEESTYSNLYSFMNYGWDQLIANNGTLNYCVRWDSTATVTSTLRDQIHEAIQRQISHWMDQMVDNGSGWNSFPYTDVNVNVVGWAVRDASVLQWTDDSVDIYVNDINEDAPQCSEPCGRFFHQDGNYPNCPGGADHHYDMSLWLTSGFSGGAGGDWGQRVSSEYFVGAVNDDNIHIVEHEIGHSFGLDDFYDWTPTGVSNFIMLAGSATEVTEFDSWMLRDWWRHLKSRYGY